MKVLSSVIIFAWTCFMFWAVILSDFSFLVSNNIVSETSLMVYFAQIKVLAMFILALLSGALSTFLDKAEQK